MDPRGRARAIQEAWPGWRLSRLFTDRAGLRVGGAGPSPAPRAAGVGGGRGEGTGPTGGCTWGVGAGGVGPTCRTLWPSPPAR